jgi:hypothetical protein
VVHVGVRGDDRLALGEREVKLTDQLDDLVDRVIEPDVDQQPLVSIVDQVDVAP